MLVVIDLIALKSKTISSRGKMKHQDQAAPKPA